MLSIRSLRVFTLLVKFDFAEILASFVLGSSAIVTLIVQKNIILKSSHHLSRNLELFRDP